MYDFKTANTSFIDMHNKLQEMGVKNNKFFLYLKNPELQGIDPLDEALEDCPDIQLKMLDEVHSNPWYCMRELFRLTDTNFIRTPMHMLYLSMLFCFYRGIDTIGMSPRQFGKTTAAKYIMHHSFHWGVHDTQMLMGANSAALRKRNVSDMRDMREYLPKFLYRFTPRKDINNMEKLRYAFRNNVLFAAMIAQSEITATRVGRGYSTRIQGLDELSFIPHLQKILAAATPAYEKITLELGDKSIHGRIFTTTAGYLNEDTAKFVYSLIQSGLRFTPSMLDKSTKELKGMVAASKSPFMILQFNHIELGKTDKWLDDIRSRHIGTQDEFDREYRLVWKDSSVDHPLGQERLEKINAHKQNSINTITFHQVHHLNFYREFNKPFDFKRPLVAGYDPSYNLRNDFNALVVIDPYNGEVVMTMKTNTNSTMLFAKTLYSLMSVFEGMILVPERAASGNDVFDRIVEYDVGGTVKPRIYSYDEAMFRTKGKVGKNKEDDGTFPLGVFPSKAIRDSLFGITLVESIDTFGHLVKDIDIVNEVNSLCRTRTGKIEAMVGCHDDMIVAYLYAMWFLTSAPGIEKYLDTTQVLLDNVDEYDNVVNTSEQAMIEKETSIKRARKLSHNPLIGRTHIPGMGHSQNSGSFEAFEKRLRARGTKSSILQVDANRSSKLKYDISMLDEQTLADSILSANIDDETKKEMVARYSQNYYNKTGSNITLANL